MARLVPAIHVFCDNNESKTWMPGTRPGMTARAFDVLSLIQRQPDDAAGTVAVVAMRGLIEGACEFPFLGFVAPLHRGARGDVVGSAIRADRCRSCGMPVGSSGRLRIQVERIEQ